MTLKFYSFYLKRKNELKFNLIYYEKQCRVALLSYQINKFLWFFIFIF